MKAISVKSASFCPHNYLKQFKEAKLSLFDMDISMIFDLINSKQMQFKIH